MADTGPNAPQQRETDKWLEPGKLNIQIVYVLYLAGFAIGITPIVGVVIAYINRGKAGGWVESHYTWAIRTFWIAVAGAVASFILMFVAVGFLLMIAIAVWIIVRCVIGLQKASREEAIADPESWWI
ncbi:MAG: hypothetical protein K8H74_11195 [Notoacmeibacter sp.]|nr:hypothetical protein [Notoacmeibacter sp.]